MNDEAIYAFTPMPATPKAPPRRWWPWVLGGIALLVLLLAIAAVAGLASLLDAAHHGVHVDIDGEEFSLGLIDGLGGVMALLGVGFGLMVALLCVLLVVPLTLLLVLGGLTLGLGGALLAVLLVAALLLSPLWLVLLVLWLVLRRRAPAKAAAA